MKAGTVILVVSIVVAIIAMSIGICTHVAPQIPAHQLLKLSGILKPTSFGFVLITIAMVFTIARDLKIRERYAQWRARSVAPLSRWIWRIVQLIMAAAFIDYIFAPSAAIRFETDRWLMGTGRGHPWLNITESEAIVHLWGNLREYAAILLIMSLLWLSAAGAIIASHWRK